MKHVTTFFSSELFWKGDPRNAYTDQYQIHPCFEDKVVLDTRQ